MNEYSNESLRIIGLDVNNIDEATVNKIYDMVSNDSRAVAIDLCNVNTCVNSFFEMFRRIKGEKLSLVNVDSRILAALYMTGYDKFVHVFEDNISLLADKHEIINRRFSLI